MLTMGTVFLFLEIKQPERLQAMIHTAKIGQGLSMQATPIHAGTASNPFFRSILPLLLAVFSWAGTGTYLVSYLGFGFFHVVAGNYYAEKGDLETSRSYFEGAVALEPENSGYLFTLGSQFLHAEKNYESAIKQFEKVIAIDPKHGEARLALATAFYFKGDFEAAKKHLAIAETLSIESKELLQVLKEDENMQP